MTPTNLRRFTVTETREAVEVTANNLDEVAAWCGGGAFRATVDDPPHAVLYAGRPSGKPLAFAYPGDVLVTDGTRWWDVPREEFKRDLLPHWTEETT